MQDTFGRTIDYLRISVTEACNFRCAYCAPNGHPRPAARPLSLAEIEQVVRAAVALGISKIRLTGGEPLLRPDILEIVRVVDGIKGVSDLTLTTNGFRLAELARPLADAGLRRVNVSLDSLRRERFARIVGVDAFQRVWNGLMAAEEAGLVPLKINVVALRGVNDDEVDDFARLSIDHPWHVRFIELMPVGVDARGFEFYTRHFVPADRLRACLPDLEPVTSPRGNGPARTYRLPDAQGTISFITPASDHFCETCNRIRVNACGSVRSCLFSANAVNVRPALREGTAATQALLSEAITAKPERHPLGNGFTIIADAMSQIGG